MTKHYYATHNTHANLVNGNRGFGNTWVVSRFPTRKERDQFVADHDHQLARAVTRREAEEIFRGSYLCVGEEVPRGGLFAKDRFGFSRFWNEIFDDAH